MDMPTKCVICGSAIEPCMLKMPCKSPCIGKYFPKEVCDECASPKPKPAVKRSYDPPTFTPYLELAGAIENGVLRQYKHLYREALDSVYAMDETLTDEEQVFVLYHKSIARSQYHSALTFDNIIGILDSARRDVENETQRYRDMIRSGYDIFKRSEING